MIQLFGYFYASVLIVALLGGVVVRASANSKPSGTTVAVRWMMLCFPLVLAGMMVLKPFGPSLWLEHLTIRSQTGKVLAMLLLVLVTLRGLAELVLVVVDWNRKLLQSIPLTGVDEEPWFVEACYTLGLNRIPEMKVHPRIKSPLLVGPLRPRILLPPGLVPSRFRNWDPIWEGVLEPAGGTSDLRVKIVHELKHVRKRDPLLLLLLALTGIVVPWEWIIPDTDLEKLAFTRTAPFRWISSFFRFVGTPFHWAVICERDTQEEQADQAVAQIATADLAYLGEARAWRAKAALAKQGLAQAWREIGFGTVAAMLLVLAPGRDLIQFAWGGKMSTMLPLPPTWSFVLEPGFGQGTAGRIAGEGHQPGRIVANVEEVVPGKWPMLKGVGRLHPDDLPSKGRVELVWDVECQNQRLKGLAVHLQFAKIAMVDDTEQGASTLRADPRGEPEDLGGGKYRYRRVVDLEHLPLKPTWVYVDFYFQGPGRYLLSPPVLEIVNVNGARRPFPSI